MRRFLIVNCKIPETLRLHILGKTLEHAICASEIFFLEKSMAKLEKFAAKVREASRSMHLGVLLPYHIYQTIGIKLPEHM